MSRWKDDYFRNKELILKLLFICFLLLTMKKMRKPWFGSVLSNVALHGIVSTPFFAYFIVTYPFLFFLGHNHSRINESLSYGLILVWFSVVNLTVGR